MINGWLAMLRRLVLAVGIAAGNTGLAVAQGQAPLLGPVETDFFGLVMNRSGPALPWPSVPFGSWRLWDAYVTWADLEPRRGQWQFERLDRFVDEARAHQTKLMLVLAHSPAWASARPGEGNAYNKPGIAAEPADIDDWRNYVRTVATRYKGRISEYQVWNEPSDRSHYTGTVAKLVELTCETQRLLRQIDPAARVVSGGSAGGGGHVQYLDDFLAAGGAACIDVVAHHFYVPRFGPEAMVPIIRQVRQVMARRGVGDLQLWSTEAGWWIGRPDGAGDQIMAAKGGWRRVATGNELAGVIQRAFLLARAEGVGRFYWYAWTNAYWGLADAAGDPLPGVTAWNTVHSLMRGRSVAPCSSLGAAFACTLRAESPQQAPQTLRWRDDAALERREGPAVQAPANAAIPILQ